MQKRHAALGMFAVLLFSYVINAIDRQLFSVLAADVRNALDLEPAAGGAGVHGLHAGHGRGGHSDRLPAGQDVAQVGHAGRPGDLLGRDLPDRLLARPARPAALPFRLGPGRGHAADRPAGHRHELLLPAPRGRRQLVELHLRHRRHHRPQPGRRHPRRHALENALHRVRPVRHRRLRTDRAAGQALVQRSASATRSGREPRRRAGRSRAGQPVGPDAAHAGRRHRLRRPVHLRLSGPVPDLSARRAGLHAQAGGGRVSFYGLGPCCRCWAAGWATATTTASCCSSRC